jgi:hypothetical protein
MILGKLARTYKEILSIVLFCALIFLSLISPSLINGFPLYFDGDSLGYIEQASFFSGYSFRTPYYGLINYPFFMTSLKGWSFVLTNGLFTVISIFILFSSCIGNEIRNTSYEKTRGILLKVSLLILISLTTLPLMTSYIMPDVFMALGGISIFILLERNKYLYSRPLTRIFVIVVTYISSVVHLSHIPCYFCLATCYLFFKNTRQIYKEVIKLYLILFVATLTLFSTNYFSFGQFTYSKNSSFWFLGRLANEGLLKEILINNCKDKLKGSLLCKLDLPNKKISENDFLWSSVQGSIDTAIFEPGSHKSVFAARVLEKDGRKIALIALRKHFLELVQISIAQAYYQLLVESGLISSARHAFNPSAKERLSLLIGVNQLESLMSSSQSEDAFMNDKYYNSIVRPIFLVSFFVLLFLAFFKKMKQDNLTFFPLVFILINCFFMSFFSGVYDRYLMRVSWIAPFFLFMIYLRSIKVISERSKLTQEF